MVVGITTSCVKYHELVKSEFPQGQDAPDVRDLTQTYVRSATVYDQFTTLAVFDALWLAPQVVGAYADMYGIRRGKLFEGCQQVKAEKERDLAGSIGFYLLADVRVKTHKDLHEKGSYWTIALENSKGQRLEATSIKSNIELDPEFQTMFAHRFNLFKEVYLVKFPTHLSGKPFITDGEPMTMLLSSPRKSIRIAWNSTPDKLKTTKKLLKNYDSCDWF